MGDLGNFSAIKARHLEIHLNGMPSFDWSALV
jgi:hypothetical protein